MLGIKFKPFLVMFVTIVMVLSTLGLFYATGNPSGGSSPASSGVTAALPSSTASNTVSGNTNTGLSAVVNNALKDKNLTKDLFIPNVNYLPGMQNNHVEPLYGQAPAPMGIGDFGLVNRGGHIVGTKMKTSSFEGTWTVNNLTGFNLGNDGPYSVTVQMNTILAHTTILGKSNFVYWTQNVIVYSTRTHSLTFEDNIWNFSSPNAYMTQNTIYNSTGNVIPYPGVHIAIGPTVTLNYPFTVNLFLNTTVLDGMDTVYFNYSIPSLMMNGTYDRVMFNSTYGMPPGYSARPAYFEVNGNKLNPVGLLYDAELMIGGPGGGSTNSIYTMNSMMSLKYLSKTPQESFFNTQFLPNGHGPMHFHAHKATRGQYLNVPSAYDFGTDTGETSEGVSVSWNAQDQAMLSAGPSLLYGMWNVSSANIMEHFTGKVSPSNAFMFVDTGTQVNPNTAGWAPLTASGSYNFWLPVGMYTAKFMLSYYNPVTVPLRAHFSFNYLDEFNQLNVKSEQSIHLKRNTEDGIYTPLFATNNAQLANISVSGNGTQSNPYIAENSASPGISPLFGEVNDFLFPVFEGVMIRNTNAYFEMNSMPDFSFQMPHYTDLFLNFFKLPETNYMGYWLYNTSNISLWNTSLITGWFSPYGAGFPYANVMLWNSSNDLVGSNTFQTMDSSMLIFGGTNNTVWGNTFTNVSPVLLNSSAMNNVSLYGAPLALSVYSSGNLIYNNNFTTTIPAYSPDYSIYTGNTAYYIDSWNITRQPSNISHYFNGYDLVGSIVNSADQGGNYWYNFDGIIPYNDSGLIANGGDYEPLNLLMVPDGPVINAPLNAIVVVPTYAAFVSHNTTSVIVNNNVYFPYGSYSNITVSFFDQYISNPFDDSFVVQVNNTEILAGNTLEIENTSVTLNVTQYYSILQGETSVLTTSPQFNPGYSSRLSTWFTFYIGARATEPNKVISAFTDINFPTPENAFPHNVPLPFNVTRTTNVTFPENITSAYLNLYEQQNGNDEFWYTLQPPFREFRIFIGNELIGTVQPYPNVQTGGGDLFLWQPILGIGAELYPPHEINLTPYLGLLHGKQKITVQVLNDENLWIRSALNFMITTSNQPTTSRFLSSGFNFIDNYTQSPQTNLSTKSIPSSAKFLNDTNNVTEELNAYGVSVFNGYTLFSNYTKRVYFSANATEFDPSFNIEGTTKYGFGPYTYENFSLNETIIQSLTNTYYIYNSSGIPLGKAITRDLKIEHYSIYGSAFEQLILNSTGAVVGVAVGFTVTQVRDIQNVNTVQSDLMGNITSTTVVSSNNTTVSGSGAFVGVLNSKFELTSLSYNNASTKKTVHSYEAINGKVVKTYSLLEVAVNNSLVNRNGTLITYEVS